MILVIEMTNDSQVRIRRRLPDQKPKAQRNEILVRLVARARRGGPSLLKSRLAYSEDRRRIPSRCAPLWPHLPHWSHRRDWHCQYLDPLMNPAVALRWFSWPNIALLAPVPLATAAVGFFTW